MLKNFLFIIFLIISSIVVTNAVNIEVSANVYNEYTEFEYLFIFNENETTNSFSIEKPEGSRLEFAKSGNVKIPYTSAGDFFIFKNNNPTLNKFTIKFISYSTSKEIIETGSFSTYINFNFPIDKLIYKVNLKDNFGKILEVFPRNYELISNSKYKWNLENIQKDTLFLIKFETGIKENKNLSNYFTEIVIFSLIFIATVLFVFVKRYLKKSDNDEKRNKKNIKENKKIETTSKKLEEKKESNLDISEKNEEEEKEILFNEIIEKYLTENEKEIVLLIKDNEGIIQNEILNYLPTLTKSNLSKIISKLHSRKILNKIKVGKINKIHLGDKFEVVKEESVGE